MPEPYIESEMGPPGDISGKDNTKGKGLPEKPQSTINIPLSAAESFAEFNDVDLSFLPIKTPKPKIVFWMENPNVLFQSSHILEFFPVESMTYSQKLNAITRAVLLMGLTIFGITHNPHIFIILAITIGAIALVYHKHNQTKHAKSKKAVRFDLDDEDDESMEPFTDKSERLAQDTLAMENVKLTDNTPAEFFDKSTPSNPFSNVLLTDYEHNPTKKTAPTSYNKYINADILGQAKELVKHANPDQPDIADKLFKDLGEEFQFEQSMRPFYSNAATTIPNDQQAFADFCYGSMVSCKEGNMFACSRKYQTRPAI